MRGKKFGQPSLFEQNPITTYEMAAPVSAIQIKDRTRLFDHQKLDELIHSTHLLDLEFQKGIESRKGVDKIDSDEKMMIYQTNFWNTYVNCIESCNDDYMEIQTNAVDEASACCKKIWKYCCMVPLYNEMIFGNWSATDLESRKRTILLAICDIERYRCKHQTNPIKDEPTEYDSSDRISVDDSIKDDYTGYESGDDDAEDVKPIVTSTPK